MPAVGATSNDTTLTMPAGGVAGDALRKSSAASRAWSWGKPAGGVPPIIAVSANWFDNRINGGIPSVALTPGANVTAITPIYLPSAVTISTAAFAGYYTAGGANTFSFGGWAADLTTGLPTSLLFSVTSSAQVQTNTGSANQVSVSATLPAGWSYLGVSATVAATVLSVDPSSTRALLQTDPFRSDGLPGYAASWFASTSGMVANPAVTVPAAAASGVPVIWVKVA